MATKRKPKTAPRQEAADFFYQHAGWGYDPAKETSDQGRRRNAERLALAERWLSEQPGHQIEWTEDTDADLSWCQKNERSNRTQYGCIVTVGDDKRSLWGIDFGQNGHPSGDPYARVVVAELALELMPDNYV